MRRYLRRNLKHLNCLKTGHWESQQVSHVPLLLPRKYPYFDLRRALTLVDDYPHNAVIRRNSNELQRIKKNSLELAGIHRNYQKLEGSTMDY